MTSPTVEFNLLAPDYPIKSVTVYKSSKAKVVRTFEVEIKVFIEFARALHCCPFSTASL